MFPDFLGIIAIKIVKIASDLVNNKCYKILSTNYL